MDSCRKVLESFTKYMDERLVKPDKVCGNCNANLQMEIEDILYYSKTSKKWLCYNCCIDVLINEDIVFFQYREDGMAEMIRTRNLPSGPPTREKRSFKICEITNEYNHLGEQNNKCKHVKNNFNDLKEIFRCQDCMKWICESCLSDHKRHSITGNVKFSKSEEMIQILPYIYEPLIKLSDLKIDLNIPKKVYLNEKFPIHLKIENKGLECIYDIEINFKIPSNIIDPLTEDDCYGISNLTKLKSVESGTIEELNLNKTLKDLLIDKPKKIVVEIIFNCRDFWDGQISKSLKTDLIICEK